MLTASQKIEAVAIAQAAYDSDRSGDWADKVDSALEAAGYEIDADGAARAWNNGDSHLCALLADGTEIRLSGDKLCAR